ncbi:TVP38/TMEM64 family protein [Enterobacillus tribolii]|uniref:TVP38/TMEM64 family membrane protein n=1 Tax=Enterobacillus tribolii TaxID=1487935 RepID=A0A370QRS7_9GAMM|nr:TVP38/TMEM64 family protein [Enterobacillus tribolii]RDK91871.1 putative membrane protein YdjX (TVP38/TMEM64 family) [Enterobacillus tribolii]
MQILRYVKLTVVVLLCAVALVAWSNPAVQAFLKMIWRLLSSLDFNALLDYLRGFGPWAAVVSFFLMIFQALAAPLPAFLITLANAALFGWWQGAILSWVSAMAAAALCFMLSRWLGREWVARWVSPAALASCDRFFIQYGKYTILICRLLPFVSFDLVSYAAGLTSIRLWTFLIATGLGQLPATLIYSYAGGMLTGGLQWMVSGLFVLCSLSIVIYIGKKKASFIRNKEYPIKKREGEKEDEKQKFT